MKKLVLASSSPRRRELMENAGYKFEVITSDVDENIAIISPEILVSELALLKAGAVAKKNNIDALIIGADTVVSLNGEILGKPIDETDACRMLGMLSGKKHQVYTGVCVIDRASGNAISKANVTDITFKEISTEEIELYVKSGESLDKAGAYGIQGGAGKFVANICGEFDNVVGLPMKLLKSIINEISDKKEI